MTIVQSPPGCATEDSTQTSCDAARVATLFVVTDTAEAVLNRTDEQTTNSVMRRPLHDLYYAASGAEVLIGFTPRIDRLASVKGIQASDSHADHELCCGLRAWGCFSLCVTFVRVA